MSRNSMLSTLLDRDLRGDLFGDLQGEMDRVFNRFREIPPFMPAARLEGGMRIVPRADISETDRQILVEVELPGVELKDVQVDVVDKALVIQGTKQSETTRDERNYHLVERSRGEFLRRVPLGFDVEADKVEASFDNGVLSVTVEKPVPAKRPTKRVEVKPAAKLQTPDGNESAEREEQKENEAEPA